MSEELSLLSELERLLQVGHFGSFWSRAKEESARKVLSRVVGVDAAVQSFIAHAIARTYQKIDLVALGAAIDVVRGVCFRYPPLLRPHAFNSAHFCAG